jgi:hypothetical protein
LGTDAIPFGRHRFERKRFDNPDKRMDFPNGHAVVVSLGGTRILRVTFEPGFRWTNDMPATAGVARCPVRHQLDMLSGTIGVSWSDGSEEQFKAGDVALLEPDHESWTIGDEPAEFLDFDPQS